jgi:hypothetical protein
VLGAGAQQRALAARFDAKQLEEDRISAVQYIRFALAPRTPRRSRSRALCGDPDLPPALRPRGRAAARGAREPGRGLRADPRSLVPPLPAGAAAEPEVLYSSGGVRVVRPVAPQLPGHLVVESSAPLAARARSTPRSGARSARPCAAPRRDAAQRHGGCRVVADFAPGAPLRWHILPRPGGSSSANRT